jgi:hypothetical protein
LNASSPSRNRTTGSDRAESAFKRSRATQIEGPSDQLSCRGSNREADAHGEWIALASEGQLALAAADSDDLSRDDLTSSATSWTVARVVPSPGSVRGADIGGEVPAGRGVPSARLGQSAQRLVLEVLDQGRNVGVPRRQENRHQRQCVRRRHSDDDGSNVLEGYVPDGPIARTPAMPPSFSRCSPGPTASTRANRRDCVRKPIPSSSPETNALTTRSTPYRMRKAQLVRQMSNGPLKLEA